MKRIGYIIAAVSVFAALAVALIQIERYRVALKQAQLADPGQTHYVGTFPQNMTDINQLVARTRFRLVIVTDYCAYGHFSAPGLFSEYEDKLDQLKNRGATVELHIYDDKTTDAMTASQFDLGDPKQSEESFETLRKGATFAGYFRFHEKDKPRKPIPTNVHEFIALMSSEQSKCISNLGHAGVFIHSDIHSPLPIFMWIRDDEEAIFSIYNFGHQAREMSLATKDPNLLSLLRSIAQNSNAVDQ